MIAVYALENGAVAKRGLEPDGTLPKGAVWIDLLQPTSEEERVVEAALAIEVPTREEMQQIEFSNRYYTESNAVFMTATLLMHAQSEEPENQAVTFVLTKSSLVTLRYSHPKAFSIYESRLAKHPTFCASADHVLINLLETVVERMADVLEMIGAELDNMSRSVFGSRALGAGGKNQPRDYLQAALRRLGRQGDLVSKAEESLHSLQRLLAFWINASPAWATQEVKMREKSVVRDLRSLSEHATFLADKVSFLLNANLGLINIEQNNIIKLFSVVAVVFLPPTLIASIYGMNFEVLPELHWPHGYPIALGAMLISAVAPYFFFKSRGWL
jgi:magnesium transporter